MWVNWYFVVKCFINASKASELLFENGKPIAPIASAELRNYLMIFTMCMKHIDANASANNPTNCTNSNKLAVVVDAAAAAVTAIHSRLQIYILRA